MKLFHCSSNFTSSRMFGSRGLCQLWQFCSCHIRMHVILSSAPSGWPDVNGKTKQKTEEKGKLFSQTQILIGWKICSFRSMERWSCPDIWLQVLTKHSHTYTRGVLSYSPTHTFTHSHTLQTHTSYLHCFVIQR